VFDLIIAGRLEPYTSAYTYQELEDTTDESHRQRMIKLIPDYGVKVIDSQVSPYPRTCYAGEL
jgi:hypothetical protein